MTAVYLIEATPYDPDASAEVTKRFSIGSLAPTYGGDLWTARVERSPSFSVEAFSDPIIGGRSRVSIGTVRILHGDGGVNLRNLNWYGRSLEVKRGQRGDALGDFTTVIRGRITSMRWDREVFELGVSDLASELDVPLQDTLYAGSGGDEGGDDIKGRPKPRCLGKPRNIAPVLVDRANLVYQFSDRAAKAVDAVYDQGLALDSEGDIRTMSLADIRDWPACGGRYVTDLANGLIRLGAPPAGTPTMDAQGDIATFSWFGGGVVVFSSIEMVKNRLAGGGANDGEIQLKAGGLFFQDGTFYELTSDNQLFTPYEGSRTAETFYVMVHKTTRANSLFNSDFDNHRFFCAEYDASTDTWTAFPNTGAGVDFTPNSSYAIAAVGSKVTASGGIEHLEQIGGTLVQTAADLVRHIAGQVLADPADLNTTSFSDANTSNSSPCSLYVSGERPTIREVAERLMASIGGFVAVDASGLLKVGVIEIGTSQGTVREREIFDLRRLDVARPYWRRKLGYARAWKVLGQDVIDKSAITDANADFMGQRERFVVAEDASIKTALAEARESELSTLLDAEADASTESSRQLSLLGARRDRYELQLQNRAHEFEVGETYTFVHSSLRVPAGQDLVVRRVSERSRESTVLEVWG